MTVESAEVAIGKALEWLLPKLESGPVGMATSASPDAVRSAQQRFGREGAARLAESIIGGLAVALREAGVRRFVVAGGETSGAVVEHLGIKRLKVGPYGGPGIGTATTEDDDPSAFCLKSGKLGPVDLFMTTLEAMQQGAH
jgi:3-dehydrotetronate 4-kinase